MYNGAGIFQLAAGNPVVTGTVISSTWANNTLSDIANNGLTNCITKDGQQTLTGNIPFSNFRPTGVSDGVNLQDLPTIKQIQNDTVSTLVGVAGTDTITANTAPVISAYAAGQSFDFIAAGANTTGTVTLNLNALGAKAVMKAGYSGLVQLAQGDLLNGASYRVRYDGTQFQLVSPTAQSPALISAGLKNGFINGNFDCWGRGTSFTLSSSSIYTCERWTANASNGAGSVSRYVLAAGADVAPIASGTVYGLRFTQTAGGSGPFITQKIEDVSRYNGRTATLTFVAFTVSGTATIPGATYAQNFGTGGSTAVTGTILQNCALTTTPQEFSIPLAIPSVSGKTIVRDADCIQIGISMPVATTFDVVIMNARIVEGTQAVPAEILPVPIVKAECERYYEKSYFDTVNPGTSGQLIGSCNVRAVGLGSIQYAVRYRTRKRTNPVITVYSPNSGASGRVFDGSAALDVISSELNIGDTGFVENAAPNAANDALSFHFVADAEL